MIDGCVQLNLFSSGAQVMAVTIATRACVCSLVQNRKKATAQSYRFRFNNLKISHVPKRPGRRFVPLQDLNGQEKFSNTAKKV